MLFQEKNIPIQQFVLRIEQVNASLKLLIEEYMPSIIALTPKPDVIEKLEQELHTLENQKKTNINQNTIKNLEDRISVIRRTIREQYRVRKTIQLAQESLARINAYFSFHP